MIRTPSSRASALRRRATGITTHRARTFTLKTWSTQESQENYETYGTYESYETHRIQSTATHTTALESLREYPPATSSSAIGPQAIGSIEGEASSLSTENGLLSQATESSYSIQETLRMRK